MAGYQTCDLALFVLCDPCTLRPALDVLSIRTPMRQVNARLLDENITRSSSVV